jgi:hypothetical protein
VFHRGHIELIWSGYADEDRCPTSRFTQSGALHPCVEAKASTLDMVTV